MLKKMIMFAAVAGLVLALAPAAEADDLFPPPWRGEQRCTFALWDDWGGWPHNMEPDIWQSSPPLEPMEATTNNSDAPVWDGQTWVLRLDVGDWVDFLMPNYPDDNEYKLARVQVTYANLGNPDQWPVLSVTGPEIEEVFGPWLFVWSGGDYITVAYDFEIHPNPGCETFQLSFDPFVPAYVDQVVIDTWCVPEPATMALLAFGGLGVVLRRKRS